MIFSYQHDRFKQADRTCRFPSRAFTLVELMVVIAVIGILVGLLLPAISNARTKAQSVACKGRLRQIGLGLQMYVQDYHGRYPHYRGSHDVESAEPASDYDARFWWAKLQPYYATKWTDPTYHCPSYKGAITQVTNRHDPLGSYAYNWRGVAPPAGPYAAQDTGSRTGWGLGPTVYRTIPGAPPPATRELEITSPSEMLAVGESRFLNQRVNGIPGGEDALVCAYLKWPYNGAGDEYAFDPKRHGKTYNLLFCDGHVSQMNPWKLFNPTNSASLWNFDHQPHPELWLQE